VQQGKLKINSWEKLLKKMRPAFLPHNYFWTMYQRLQNWSQGAKSVDEYMEEFYKLLMRVDLSESDKQLVSWYIEGLQTQILDTLNLFDPNTILEAYQMALLIKKTSMRGSLSTFGCGGIGSYNSYGGLFTNQGSTQPNGLNKMTTTAG
jgi:hypothetical protein